MHPLGGETGGGDRRLAQDRLLVLVRDRLHAARASVVGRGWHHNRLVGGPLRWLGKRLP
jgi:hypothetical protein